MSYDTEKHKIREIWLTSGSNEVNLDRKVDQNDQLKTKIIKSPIINCQKKIFTIETDWQIFEDISTLPGYGTYYLSEFNIYIEKFPLQYLPNLQLVLIYKHSDIPKIDLLLYRKVGLFQVFGLGDTEDINTAVKSINIKCIIWFGNQIIEYGNNQQIQGKIKVSLINPKLYQ
jgi:hypothetical protein